jgi:mRNA-degrading endonuclease RelE of RelBE toxin-antitoxin system
MPTLRFLFTREAIRAWRRLPSDIQRTTNDTLLTLADHASEQLKKSEYRRTYVKKDSRYRIIWRCGRPEAEYLVARLGLRNEKTYGLPLDGQAKHEFRVPETESLFQKGSFAYNKVWNAHDTLPT